MVLQLPSSQDACQNSKLDSEDDKVTKVLVDASHLKHGFGFPVEVSVSSDVKRKTATQAKEDTQQKENEPRDVVPSYNDPCPMGFSQDDEEPRNRQHQGSEAQRRVQSLADLPVVLQVASCAHLHQSNHSPSEPHDDPVERRPRSLNGTFVNAATSRWEINVEGARIFTVELFYADRIVERPNHWKS